MIRVQVSDTGTGIQAEEMPKLFKLFGKLKRTAEINDDGIGLGLLICKNLINMNGGQISVESSG